MYLTGLIIENWDALWEFLDPSPENVLSAKSAATEEEGRLNCPGAGRKPQLSQDDQLLMTMMRLRLGRNEQDLAYQFGVSVSCVSRTIIMWINFMYLRLGLIPIWPDWEDVEKTMPKSFKAEYPNTFAIIDATELKCEVPSSLSLQSQHYSAYKSHCTYKCLVAVAPNGSFIFVSEMYTGSISDQQLFLDSGIMDLLKHVPQGKSIMADRGFEVQDLLAKSNLVSNMPPFKGPNVLPKGKVKDTQRIARLRIHIERAIGHVKNRFRIFKETLPLTASGCITQMWTVGCLLSNFFGPIIDDKSSPEDMWP